MEYNLVKFCVQTNNFNSIINLALWNQVGIFSIAKGVDTIKLQCANNVKLRAYILKNLFCMFIVTFPHLSVHIIKLT